MTTKIKKMGIGLTEQHTYTGDRGLTRATTWGDESGGALSGPPHEERGGRNSQLRAVNARFGPAI
jgi:hypothetical protein